MRGDLWHEADELFRRALDLPPVEREAFVDQACSGRPELGDAVRALLGAAAASGDFLEGGIAEIVELPTSGTLDRLASAAGDSPERTGWMTRGHGPAQADRSGDRIGPFRLIRRVGQGGMASVYLAERADGQFDQQVAIKLLRRGYETADVVGRLRAERQILSSLAHPNVARLLDGGTTSDGHPYLVMEFVDGTPIVSYCDEHGLTIDRRLRLFCDVGRAVQHAHRNLIVHRDLKPSNILVGDEGRVKLLDFGIAKLIPSDADPQVTRIGLRALTPAYASPEQIAGDLITTASDVYQLGLLLCELLSGSLPYDVALLSPARAERAITETDPAPPSELITEGHATVRGGSREAVARRLRGDLDTIVMQALRKRPEARYASAEALVDDVERYLRGLPVRARADTVGYRARKFAVRHRVPLAGAGATALVLIAAVILSTVQAQRLGVERDRALAQEARAERVTEFLADVFRLADPNELAGDDLATLDLLERGAVRARRELEDEPHAQAEVLSTIGSMYLARAMFEPAITPLSSAVDLRRTHPGEERLLVRDLLRLGKALPSGSAARASAFDEALALARSHYPPRHPALAAVQAQYVYFTSASVAQLDTAIAILREHRGTDRQVDIDLAWALDIRGQGQGLDGVPLLEEALALRRAAFGNYHTDVATTLSNLALALEPHDPFAADSLLEQATRINFEIHGPDHSQSLTIANNLAGRYRDRGDFAEAESLYREVLRRRGIAYPLDSIGRAYTLHGLGWSLTELGRAEEAESHLREVVQILDDAPVAPIIQHVARSTLGRSLAVQRRFREAEPLLLQSYEWAAENNPSPHFMPFLAGRLETLYEQWGRREEADRFRALRLDWSNVTESAPEAARIDSPGTPRS